MTDNISVDAAVSWVYSWIINSCLKLIVGLANTRDTT